MLIISHYAEPKILVGGNDFYAFPRIDPKGERVAWIEWGHPNMPWDRSELWVGYVSENGYVELVSLCFLGTENRKCHLNLRCSDLGMGIGYGYVGSFIF